MDTDRRRDHGRDDQGGQSADISNPMLDQEKIIESLQYISSCDTGIFKNEETLAHLANIELVADNGGWSQAHLGILIEQLTSVSCPAVLTRRLLYSLIPSETIPAKMLVQLAMWGLGDRSLSRDCVVLPTLKFITHCLQYDCVTDKTELDCLYELLLSLLSRDKLTNIVAELLQFLTTKNEVTEWRVRIVLRIQAKMGSSYFLDSLLWRCRQFRPDLVPNCPSPAVRVVAATTVIGKRFHKVWEERIDKSLDMGGRDGMWYGGQMVGNIFKKGKRHTMIPGREALSVSSGVKVKWDMRLEMTDMRSIREVVSNIQRVKLPANMLALLGCRAIVQVLAIDHGLVERFSLTLFHTLRNEFICSNDHVGVKDARRLKRREQLLSHLVTLQETVQQGLPVVGRFLSEYLDTWDGSSHFVPLLRLVSQLQITDYKELHDCVVSPLTKHFATYNMVKQLVMLGFLHMLLRSWGAIEYERFTKHKAGIFPLSSVHCENALSDIIQLSTEIGELAMLALSLSREKGESTTLLTSQVLAMYRTSQLVLLEFSVPVRIELPSAYLYSALFSHSSGLLAQACQHVLLNKKKVFPYLHQALRSMEALDGFDNYNTSLVADMVSGESMEELLVATRDMLVFLSPGSVNLTMGSLLRQGWSPPLGEEWLKEGLYLSSHPALLPYVLAYLDNLNLSTEERQIAWLQLSEEEEDQQGWEKNITMGQKGHKINSRNFYSNQAVCKTGEPVTSLKLGNVMELLQLVSRSLPEVEELVLEYRQKTGEGLSKVQVRRETDLRSVCSQETEDSGMESMLPRNKGKTRTPAQRGRRDTIAVQETSSQGHSRDSSLTRNPLSRQGTITSSLQQNLSQSTPRSRKENTISKGKAGEKSIGTRGNNDSRKTENVVMRGNNKRKKSGDEAMSERKRKSTEGRNRGRVLKERN